jgi:hypothetical protein
MCVSEVLYEAQVNVFHIVSPELTNSVVPDPEGSSPSSQEPATSIYPESGESTPHTPSHLSMVYFDPILPSVCWSSVSLFLQAL